MSEHINIYAAETPAQEAVSEQSLSEIEDDLMTSILPDSPTDEGSSFSITYDNGNGNLNGALKIVLILTAISFLPAALIMLTSFTRIIIVMHFTRTALGTQTSPPNQVLIGLSIFLTIFIMAPVLGK
ncbi:MAG: flagellar biosynthetic protein FliP, partial [Lachnospiraceae bacterium]|nr:flagellar biosynthetic protein FliP [Lachnospiraceae bacterium]